MVMGGLVATTPHMVSATVLALARLTYEFAAAMQVGGTAGFTDTPKKVLT